MADSGIYEIVNRVNGKRYIGSAVTLAKRWNLHRHQLRAGKHHSRPLLSAWRKYGEPAFDFRVIEKCAPECLIEREQAAFDLLRPEYNACKTAGSTLGVKYTADSRKRMSDARKG